MNPYERYSFVDRWWSNLENMLNSLVRDGLVEPEITAWELISLAQDRCPLCGVPHKLHNDEECERLMESKAGESVVLD